MHRLDFRRIGALLISIFILIGCSSGSDAPINQDDSNKDNPAGENTLEQALRSGDASVIETHDILIDAALSEIERSITEFDDIKKALYTSNGSTLKQLDWNPSHDSSLLDNQYPFNDVVLYTNTSFASDGDPRKRPIAIAGASSDISDSTRYMVFGGNPLRTTHNPEFDAFLNNSIRWLSDKTGSNTNPLKVVISQLDESYYFPDRSATRTWLDETYEGDANYNEASQCNGNALLSCVNEQPDLLIISQHMQSDDELDGAIAGIEQALKQGTPVLYIHHNGDLKPLGNAIFKRLKIHYTNDNYWWKLGLTSYDPTSITGQLPEDIANIQILLNNFKSKGFDVDLSVCSVRSCPDESNAHAEFFAGADAVKSIFNQYDREKFSLFETTSASYNLNKLLILLADQFRQSVSFPMDKTTTDTNAFFQSLYADYAVYNHRNINPVQKDLGNFSRSDFSHITPTDKTITLNAKPYFRSAGVYAIPGVTMTVTRTDNQPVNTKLFINSLRTSATHIFNENGYNRPYQLQSEHIEIAPGETIALTSSYGGPVQIEFDGKDQQVSFDFQQIGLHAHWRDASDDEIFAQRLEAAEFDWAEIATEGFEVHSRLPKLKSSLEENIWPLASDFANATMRYTHNKVHVLAGFQGPHIDKVPEIHDFIEARGLSIDTIDIVKHMNADQPTCGWGCSGNPYDAGWNFSPVGHGDIHELGHGIERAEMRFDGYGGHSNTNFYSYYAKSIYEDDTGKNASCQALPFEQLYNVLKQSKQESDSFSYVANNRSKSWSEHHAIYLQLMMAAEDQNKLENGWHIYPRLHIWLRQYWVADNSEESWNNMRNSLGFHTYAYSELETLTRNDWLLISLSEVTQLDLVNWFKLYGFATSVKAQQQVASKNYDALGDVFYAADGSDYCRTLSHQKINIGDLTDWPHTTE